MKIQHTIVVDTWQKHHKSRTEDPLMKNPQQQRRFRENADSEQQQLLDQYHSGNTAGNSRLKSESKPTEGPRRLPQPTLDPVPGSLQPQPKLDLGASAMYDLSGAGARAGERVVKVNTSESASGVRAPSNKSRSDGASSPNPYGYGYASASGNSMTSKESKNSGSVLIPRILPRAFHNISSRFLPSDVEHEGAGWTWGRNPQNQKQYLQRRYLSKKQQQQQQQYQNIHSERSGMHSCSLSSSPLRRIMSEESLNAHDELGHGHGQGQERKKFQNAEIEDNSKDDDISMSNSESEDGSGISHGSMAAANEISNDATPMITNRRNISGISENRNGYTDTSYTNYQYGATTSNRGTSSMGVKDDVDYGDTEISPLLSQVESKMDQKLCARPQRDDLTPGSISMSMSSVPSRAHARTLTKRSIRHRIFLILTDPQSSMLSAIICVFFVFLIAMSNLVIFLKTMDKFQYTPDECTFCDNFVISQSQASSSSYENEDSFSCKCPPEAMIWLDDVDQWIMALLTVEWVLRALCYDPPRKINTSAPLPFANCCRHLVKNTTILDALATFPYYMELYEDTIFDFLDGSGISHGHLSSLRFLRFFRVFQMVRLGSHTSTFSTIVNVLAMAVSKFVYLLGFIFFGGTICASLAFWFERGEWRYTDLLDPPGWAWVRPTPNGLTEELSPFASIPDALYWFMVTSTTVGYGDVYPTSPGGKIVAGFTMTLGVLGYAFPVSIFSELWQRELKYLGAYTSISGAGSSADGDGDSVYDPDESKSDTTPPKIISTLTPVGKHNKRNNDSSQPSIGTNEENSQGESKSVCVPRDDLLAIRHYMATIDDAQAKLKEILNKMERS